ncbi:hypothetical protein SUDANB121_04533 [Nocardiopsis dassonvillei]
MTGTTHTPAPPRTDGPGGRGSPEPRIPRPRAPGHGSGPGAARRRTGPADHIGHDGRETDA